MTVLSNVCMYSLTLEQRVATAPGEVETCVDVICVYNYRHLDAFGVN
jgi:hypothetical protein